MVTIKSRFRILATVAVLMIVSIASAEETLNICSFNIKWLGLYREKENKILSEIISSFDIVVIQEIIAPPYAMNFPDGTPYKPDERTAAFFDDMKNQGFNYWLSEENTGPGKKTHANTPAQEWWAVFYKPDKVTAVQDLPHGFIAGDRAGNPDYSRVPYAFSFRCGAGKNDFVLINVHLNPNAGSEGRERRKHELASIVKWIEANEAQEKDFIILGDCNVQNTAELIYITPAGFVSLNIDCIPTNVSLKRPKPFDHVFYRPRYTREINPGSFGEIDLLTECFVHWEKPETYPGKPYDYNTFQKHFSDHKPVYFRLNITVDDDSSK